jgi:FkbM family methyltransferase
MGRPRQSVFGPLLVAAALVVAAVMVTRAYYGAQVDSLQYFSRDAHAEFSVLARKYGPERFSRNVEEWAIRDFFQDRRNGVFLDVGANHYRDENNTYFLEQKLGWSGVAVDALEEFGPDYVTNRPRTKFVATFASDESNGSVEFFVPEENKLMASVSVEFTERYGGPAGKPRQVPTATLNAILEKAAVQKVDFVSMDIELAEPKALAGFDIDRYSPELICIEAHPDVRQQILDYFAAHGYVLVGKYLRADPINLYFQRSPAR